MWLSDEEYIYRQGIKEKKSVGRGAFHKKNGSKSKKCNFPSDYMTKKERDAMNGEVMSYNPNAWYTWEEFKRLPMEYQVKYVNSLLGKYECGINAISNTLFGLNDRSLALYLSKHDQLQYINVPHKPGGFRNPEGKKRFIEDGTKAREEIQNGSDEAVNSEELKELTIQEKIKQAQDTVDLYDSRGMQITPELINQIYEEKTGMSFAMAMNYCEEESQPCANEMVNIADIPVKQLPPDPPILSENSTNIERLSIVMDQFDFGLMASVRDMFYGKTIRIILNVESGSFE